MRKTGMFVIAGLLLAFFGSQFVIELVFGHSR